ncbi:hypothetical protein [Sphingomonas hankyongi]|uniref:Uncharacterized protein n=1 Tax=Sphingomonas hankyongi TaxID=2908209 RepID=A0ABT0S1A1_9SPHN|nr:hypothetical protein [Sphingomonas hankyongi]MCL6729506.1 hypothetical protein [Sphingomonas hankyongi]
MSEPASSISQDSKRGGFGPLLSKIALELFIVFVGVSAAFAVENYRDARAQDGRREAVYRALDRELKQMAETHGPMMHRRITEQLDAWDKAVARGEKPIPPAFRIPDAERPPTGVWNAAIATGTIELVEPELMFELARFYTRAETVGDLYQRYSAAAQVDVWPYLKDGPSAFWEPDGQLKHEIAADIQRLRDFRDWQGRLSEEARLVRKRLAQASND